MKMAFFICFPSVCSWWIVCRLGTCNIQLNFTISHSVLNSNNFWNFISNSLRFSISSLSISSKQAWWLKTLILWFSILEQSLEVFLRASTVFWKESVSIKAWFWRISRMSSEELKEKSLSIEDFRDPRSIWTSWKVLWD